MDEPRTETFRQGEALWQITQRIKAYGWRFVGGERVWRHESGFMLRLIGGVSNFRIEDAEMRTVTHLKSLKRSSEAIVEDVANQVAKITRELVEVESE